MRFSVIVPARDDPRGVGMALAGLSQQTLAPDEVIVVNGSERPLARLPASTLALRVVEAGPSFPGKARNVGALAAKHPWLAFLDAGTCPVSEWLDSFRVAAERHPDVQVIYGCFLPSLRDEWDRAAAGVYLPARPAPDQGSHPTSASLCVQRSFWLDMGGMPEGLRAGEDLLFFQDIDARGAVTALAPAALVAWDLPAGAWAHYWRLRRYSAATWPTDLSRSWHWPLIRMYASALALGLAAPFVHPAALAVVPALAAGRIARNYHLRATGLSQAFTPTRALRLLAMTGLIDAATFAGIWDAIGQRQQRR